MISRVLTSVAVPTVLYAQHASTANRMAMKQESIAVALTANTADVHIMKAINTPTNLVTRVLRTNGAIMSQIILLVLATKTIPGEYVSGNV